MGQSPDPKIVMEPNADLPTEYRPGAHWTQPPDTHGALLWVGIGTIPAAASATAVQPTSPPSSGTHLSTKLCWEASGEFGGTRNLFPENRLSGGVLSLQ